MPPMLTTLNGKDGVSSQMDRPLGRVPKWPLLKFLAKSVRNSVMSLSMSLLDLSLEWMHHKSLGPSQVVMLWYETRIKEQEVVMLP